MASYRTHDGDTLDYIAFKYYGSTDATERLIGANRDLAEMPPILPGNVLVQLPDLVIEQPVNQVRLWD